MPVDFWEMGNKDKMKYLMKEWGLETPVVKGVIKFGKNNTCWLTDVRSLDGRQLKYSMVSWDAQWAMIKRGVFVGSNIDIEEGSYVTGRFKLAPEEEQKRWRNPLLIRIIRNTVRLLYEIPEWAIIHNKDGGIEVESTLLDFLAKNRSQEIDQIRNALQDEVGRLQVKKDQLESCENELRDKIERSGELLLSIEKEMARIELKKNMIMEYLEELRNYVENRAERLLKLGLLTELQYNDLRGAMRTPRDERALWPGLDDFQNRYVDAISYIQRYLYDKGIIYPRALLETFLTILRTGDLIILSGLSGAGKTQLVKAFSEATGNVAHIIPVKPNWTSSEDLLGYYNPMQRAYMTTPFLDALIAAKRDPDRLHIICLDEMNLARVEYYFADFLSALEERVKVPTIALYSEEEAGHVQSELQLFVDLLLELGEGRELNSFGDFLLDEQVMRALKERLGVTEAESFIQLHARLRRMLAGVLNVPAVLEIPENVRFVGAVNVDETTHYFSPKVLDRAHVLQFQSPLNYWRQVESEVQEVEPVETPIRLSASEFSRPNYPAFDPFQEDFFVKTVREWVTKFLNPIGIEIGLRAIKQSVLYRNYLRDVLSNPEEVDKVALNNILRQKILPRLSLDGKMKPKGFSGKETCIDVVKEFYESVDDVLPGLEPFDAKKEMQVLIERAHASDGIFNYWM